MLLSTMLSFTQFQYMWLTYTGTIAFILVATAGCCRAVCSKFWWLSRETCEAQQDQSRPNTLGISAAGFVSAMSLQLPRNPTCTFRCRISDAFLCQWSKQYDYQSSFAEPTSRSTDARCSWLGCLEILAFCGFWDFYQGLICNLSSQNLS